jgi:chromosomal replication initiator protein
MHKDQLWSAALGSIEVQVSKAIFTTWFKSTSALDLEDEHLLVAVPSDFHKGYLEKNYSSKLLKHLQDISTGEVKKISFIVTGKKQETAKKPSGQVPTTSISEQQVAPQTAGSAPSLDLNPNYIFGHFIVGKSNELAHAACQAVARKPGEVYNPLFLYGGVGLGKTHLVQAIGHEVRKNFGNKNVLYISSERFTNEFIQSVRMGETEKFKQFYRSVDLLIIDDIQFLAGKEQTQEEFFHTFNALHQANKQIVITSDRPPKAIPALEARLVSRFEWGMIADVGTPDLETRIAILENKCKEKDISLSRDTLQYIAAHAQHNVRELEGVLNSIIASTQLYGTQPTLEVVKSILAPLHTSQKTSALTAKDVVQLVAKFYNVAAEIIMGESRKKEYVGPRQVAMYLMREELKSSYPAIGNAMGGRDHTTVMHGCEKVEKNIQDDPRLAKDISTLRQQLYA